MAIEKAGAEENLADVMEVRIQREDAYQIWNEWPVENGQETFKSK